MGENAAMEKRLRNPPRTVPTLLGWLGDTELQVMARHGNAEESRIAKRILQRDKHLEATQIEEQIANFDTTRSFSSLHLILGDAGPGHPGYRPPADIPGFGRLILLFSRNGISREDFEGRFLPRFRSFLWKRCKRSPENLSIDVPFLEIDPWDYHAVYDATNRVLKENLGPGFDREKLYFNLTPGTVTQEITLALIGKELSPVRFIQVDKSRRSVSVCDIPWNLNLIRQTDAENVARDFVPEIASLFPDTEEGVLEKNRLAAIARVDVDCLLTGETGVGKNWVAETVIRKHSDRRDKPFVAFNCASLGGDLNMLRSQLFGAVPGSATGIPKNGLTGLAETADGGILFLDELECLNREAQGVLLDFIQPKEEAASPMERTFMKVGGTEPQRTNLRIVSATNRDLRQMVQEGQFREDLYWRLAQVTFHVPSIKERMDRGIRVGGDSVIVSLAKRFLEEFGAHWKRKASFSPEALQCLEALSWPGNVRQLRDVVRRVLLFAPEDGVIDLATVRRELRENDPSPSNPSSSSPSPAAAVPAPPPASGTEELRAALDRELAEARARYAQEAVKRAGTRQKAAALLDVSRQTLAKWMGP